MNDEPAKRDQAELSRLFRLAELADAPQHRVEIVATEAERTALAQRFSLPAVDALSAHLTVRNDASGEIIVEGRLEAEVVQECVVTLEPVSETVAAPLEQRYTRQPAEPVADLVITPDDLEPPEPVVGDTIDLGELVAQHLLLSLNPYPRGPDADDRANQYRSEAPEAGPFAALAKLRDSEPRG